MNWHFFFFVFYTLVRIHSSKNLRSMLKKHVIIYLIKSSTDCYRSQSVWLLLTWSITSLLKVYTVTSPEVSILRCLKQWSYRHLFFILMTTPESMCQETRYNKTLFSSLFKTSIPPTQGTFKNLFFFITIDAYL